MSRNQFDESVKFELRQRRFLGKPNWRNIVFEDTGFFSYVLLPKGKHSSHSIGITGKYSVETMCVTNSFGNLEYKSLGL